MNITTESWTAIVSVLGVISGASTVLNLALTFTPDKPKPEGALGWVKWSLNLIVDLSSFASQRGSVGIGGTRLSIPGVKSRVAGNKASPPAPLVIAALGALLAGGCSSAHAAVANPTMQQSCANYLAALTDATPAPTTTTTASAGQWGDGSDGTVTLTGTNDVPWATRSGTVYTLTRPVFFNSLTVNNGVTLNNGGQPIFGKGTLTTIGTGTIRASYGASGGSSGPSAAQVNSLGGRGGNSGNGGAAGGAVTSTDIAMLHAYSPATFGSVIVRGVVSPVTGGSGGGSRGILPGGRGGGVLSIAFRIFNLASASSLMAPGAAGADGVSVDMAASGGGGGGGLNLVYWRKNAVTFSPAINCPGGAGGGGTFAGSVGDHGNIIEVVIQ